MKDYYTKNTKQKNLLSQIPFKGIPDFMESKGIDTCSYHMANLKVSVHNKQVMTITTHRLLDYLISLHTSDEVLPMTFKTTDYMEYAGLKDRKEAKKQIEEDLERLACLNMEFITEQNGKLVCHVIRKWGYQNKQRNKFGVHFEDDAVAYYKSIKRVYQIPNYHRQINLNKQTIAYFISQKIIDHLHQNGVNEQNQIKLSIGSILKSCQAGLPQNIDKRNETAKIRTSIEKALFEHLKNQIQVAYYFKDNKDILLMSNNIKMYEEWETAYCLITILDHDLLMIAMYANENKKQIAEHQTKPKSRKKAKK